MKKLFFAISVLFSTLAQAETYTQMGVFKQNNTSFIAEDGVLTSYAKGNIEGSFSITITDERILSGDGTVWISFSSNFTEDTKKVPFTFVKGQKNKVYFSSNEIFSPGEEHFIEVCIQFGGYGVGIKGTLFQFYGVKFPDVRKMVVFNTTNVTPSQIVLDSKITTPNIDDVASYEVFDANGNSLMKVTETIFATVDAITFTKSFIIDLVKYPTASTLTTTSSTGGSQKMKLKSANVGISSLVLNGVLTDEKIITIFYSNGASTETTWGEGKYLTNRISTIQVDNEIVRDVPIFIR